MFILVIGWVCHCIIKGFKGFASAMMFFIYSQHLWLYRKGDTSQTR